MAPSVHVSNIGSKTTKNDLHDFFLFCGTVTQVEVHEGADQIETATVFFEDNEAADTAALLTGTELGGSAITVVRADESRAAEAPVSSHEYKSETDVPQEHKPRPRILAELLAHGYHLTDQVISKALEADKQRGVSSRLGGYLKNLDQRFKPQEQVRGLDAKYNVSGHITNFASSWKTYLDPYVESASKSPTGSRIRSFYLSTVESAQQVHNEAMWIKKHKLQKNTCQCKSSTKESCSCAPGTCKCAQSHQSAASTGSSTEKGSSSTRACPCGTTCTCVEPCTATTNCACRTAESGTCACEARKGTEKDCKCGTQSASCPCSQGACACANCPKSPSTEVAPDYCVCACQGDSSKCTCPSEKGTCKSCKTHPGDKELYQ